MSCSFVPSFPLSHPRGPGIGWFTRRLKILYGFRTLLVLYVLADSVISEWPGIWQPYLFIPAVAATICVLTFGWALIPTGATRSARRVV